MKLTDAIKRIRTDAIPVQCEDYAAWLAFDRALGRALDEAKFLEECVGTTVRTSLVERGGRK